MLLLAIVFCFANADPVEAQNGKEGIWFKKFGMEEGAYTGVYKIHQDEHGFLWFATVYGIVRYDGYEFKAYKIEPEEGGFTKNTALQLVESQDGTMWVAYENTPYLAYYNKTRGDFSFLHINGMPEITEDVTSVIILGEDNSANLWLALNLSELGLEPLIAKLNSKTHSLHIFANTENESLLDNSLVMRRELTGTMSSYPFYATKNGTGWIGADNGLTQITPDNSIHSFSSSNSGLGNNQINFIHGMPQGNIWVATEGGIFEWNENEKTIDALTVPDGLKQTPVHHIYEDHSGIIWITAESGTWRYNFNEDHFEHLNGRESLEELTNPVMFPRAENENEIWFINRIPQRVAYADTRGITRYQKETDTFTVFTSNDEELTGLTGVNRLSDVAISRDGCVWVSIPFEGLFQYPNAYRKFSPYHTEEELNEFEFIEAAFESPDGKIFTATSQGKIFVLDEATGKQKLFYTFEVEEGNYVNHIFWEEPGQMLVATTETGIQRLSYHPNTLQAVFENKWLPSDWGGGYPETIIRARNGNIWVGLYQGVMQADFDNDKFEIKHAVESDEFTMLDLFGTKVFEDSNGNLWYFGVYGGGVKKLNPVTGKVEILNEVMGNFGVSTDLVFASAIIEHSNGNIYAASDGLFVLEEDTFEPLAPGFDITFNALSEGEDGTLVTGTSNDGVLFFDAKGNFLNQLSSENGLSGNNVTKTLYDAAGFTWIIHEMGLSRYKSGAGYLKNYTHEHGLPAVGGYFGHIFTNSSSGKMTAGWYDAQQVVFFDPVDLPVNNHVETPVISNISLDGESQPLFPEEPQYFSYDHLTLGFSFTAAHYTDSKNNQYKIRLNGLQDEWSSWNNTNSVTYNRLPPGNYQLDIQARNSDLIASPQTATYTFTIVPPWYKSGAAYFFYVIIGGGMVVYLAFGYSNYRTKQESLRLQAEQADKLAKLDRMKTNLLTNISHELRTPLTLVLGPLEQLRDKASTLGESWKRKLEISIRNGERLHQLVEQVLDLTRLDSHQLKLDPSVVELTSFLRRTAESFESMATRNEVNIETNLPDGSVIFQADADKLEKICINLLSNAIKFTPQKGTVKLSLKNQENGIQIKISDTGRGIAPKDLPHIYDRFHTSSEQLYGGGKGLGVGLSITRELIELHKGTITVESEPGKGTDFTIFLPSKDYGLKSGDPISKEEEMETASEESQNELASVAAPVFSLSGEEKKPVILLVEDNIDMRHFITELLHNAAMHVETAKHGLEGLKKITMVTPDLIITDIMMPEMDGFEFAAKVRSNPEYRLTPILMLSARVEVEARIQGFEIGISDYLNKPFNEKELKARITNLLMLKSEREKMMLQQNEANDEGSVSIDTEFVNMLKDYVVEHISDTDISAEVLCNAGNVSRRQLYRNLKSATGFTPAEFVKEIKLNHARYIIETKQVKTVSEAAYMVGFSTPFYFAKVYTKRFATHPKELLNR